MRSCPPLQMFLLTDETRWREAIPSQSFPVASGDEFIQVGALSGETGKTLGSQDKVAIGLCRRGALVLSQKRRWITIYG
ncbi:hypothetical protein CC2G_001233 [Coprinopsis cinerea AmutBmut pab1-1]|nr:hypothetical protein CC2G_001233 [Coprinopsis cinerea AmutBmut pab1-1]